MKSQRDWTPPTLKPLGKRLLAWLDRLDALLTRRNGLLVGAAALIALFAWLYPRSGDSQPHVEGTPRSARLVLTDMVVHDPSYEQAHRHARLEITVHNFGGRLVVVDGARIEVRQVYEIRRCTTQGDLILSNSYGVLLPVGAKFGYTIEKPLHQQIGPDQADRFGISFGTNIPANSEPAVYLFEVEVALRNDGPHNPLPLGRAILSLPEKPTGGQYFWGQGTIETLKNLQGGADQSPRELWAEAMPCWRMNTAIFRQFLNGDAERSPEIKAIPGELLTPSFSKLE